MHPSCFISLFPYFFCWFFLLPVNNGTLLPCGLGSKRIAVYFRTMPGEANLSTMCCTRRICFVYHSGTLRHLARSAVMGRVTILTLPFPLNNNRQWTRNPLHLHTLYRVNHFCPSPPTKRRPCRSPAATPIVSAR